ncbi:MAG: tetratricopeptide repeat protein [Pacificimonas sp.]
MAKPPANADPSSDAFLREVDDAYRSDRLGSFWDRYGRWMLVGIGALLIGVAALLWWQEQGRAAADTEAETFDRAVRGLDLGDAEARDRIETYAAGDVAGYSDLARLLSADLALEDGNIDGALAIYEAAAADASLAQPLRDLAAIRVARLTFDEADPDDIIARMEPLAIEGAPWFGIAGELLAAAQLKTGNRDEARDLFAAVAATDGLQPTLRGRASQMAAYLGATPPAATIEEEGLDEPTAPIAEGTEQ